MASTNYAKYTAIGGGSGGGSGTVTSVGLADGSTTPIYQISGSPVTSSGTLTFTLKNENANLVFSGPSSGGAAQPSFRALVAADLPASYQTIGNLTDVGTDGITITGGTNSVLGSGTSISQHVADSTHNGYLSSTDWTTFNNKQAAGNYITALTGDVTATGPGSVAATLASFANRVYVDFLIGNDSTGTGTPVSPWKTLQHAYNSISPSINEPYVIYISGGNNSTDSSPITGKADVSVIADYLIQVPAITITSPIANSNGCTFINIEFLGPLTWIRTDSFDSGVTMINCACFSGPIVKNTSTGTCSFFGFDSQFANAEFQLANGGYGVFNTCTFYGTNTFDDPGSGGAGYIDFNGGYSSSAMSFTGLYNPIYFTGFVHDVAFGASVSFSAGVAGPPPLEIDANGLPPTYTGTPGAITYLEQAKYEAFIPTTSSNWNSVPSVTGSALDNLASSGIVKSQSQNLVLASPNGSSGVPSFRALVTADMPSGVVDSLAAVGSSPNADAATISGNTLNLQPFDGTHPGVVTASGGGTTNFLRADGTWAVPPGGGGGSGTVTSVDMTVPGFLSVSGNPITTSGTLAVSYSGTALPAANGGTGLTSPGTAGNALISTGSAWTSAPISGSSAFAAYASSQVTTISSALSTSTFTTFSNSPAFTFTPTISGTYKVYANACLNMSGGTNANAKIFNTSGSATLLQESIGGLEADLTGAEVTTIFIQSVYSLVAGTTYIFDIQGCSLGGGGSLFLDGRGVASSANGAPFYMFAEGISLTTPQPTGSYAQAYFGSGSNWSTSSATYVDPTNSGGNTLTVRQSSNITLTAAASNVCGITFTPAVSSAVYLIYAQVSIYNTGSSVANVQMTDGTTVISNPPGFGAGGIDGPGTPTLGGIYVPGTSSSVTIKLQFAAPGGGTTTGWGSTGGSLGNSVEWTVLRIV